MDPLEKRGVADTGIEVTVMGLGGTSHGGMYGAVDERAALATVEHAYGRGIRYFDVAPFYGFGQAERLFGEFLSTVPRDSFVLSTKVGRIVKHGERPPGNRDPHIFPDAHDVYSEFDFSRDGVLRSIEESLDRLKLDRVDILYVHDPDVENAYRTVLDETVPLLHELRRQKVVSAIGVGMNATGLLIDFARDADFDCFLLAGRYTLLDQSAAEELLPLCSARGISVVIGGAYNSGILATGAKEGAFYDYQPAPPQIIEKTRRIELACERHGVPLKAAALQFSFGHPAVISNVPGTRARGRFDENMQMLQFPIPPDFWAELKLDGLLAQDAPIPA